MARKLVLACLVAAVVWSTVGFAEEGFVIVVHPENKVSAMTPSEASDLFLKKVAAWPGGVEVVPVDRERSSAVREAFSQRVHQRAVTNILSFWQRQVFSGQETPPSEVGSDEAVLEFVRANRGGIGYVSVDAPVDGIRVVQLTNPG